MQILDIYFVIFIFICLKFKSNIYIHRQIVIFLLGNLALLYCHFNNLIYDIYFSIN